MSHFASILSMTDLFNDFYTTDQQYSVERWKKRRQRERRRVQQLQKNGGALCHCMLACSTHNKPTGDKAAERHYFWKISDASHHYRATSPALHSDRSIML